MTQYKVTVQDIEFKTFESDSGYNMVSLVDEINKAIFNNMIDGYDNTKPTDIKITPL